MKNQFYVVLIKLFKLKNLKNEKNINIFYYDFLII